ncbi:uncharacterized protein LOC129607470 [Condylostylus longicornis]|uniref:uncharacterized protein LOC129607470 n=1 Tax=Condylostylus longicornis TaxID=2530218 RepID=UPI00244DEEA4|nr:uncharacterized protein LOC129607470 [Condylostylus longicornis]
MGKLIIYGNKMSPPVRACFLTAAAIQLDYEFRELNVINGDHLSPEYVKKNPQHTFPMLEDDGKYIWDSHAIIAYLVGKYAKDDSLYPKDLYQRAIVDQRLHFECGVLFPKLRESLLIVVLRKERSDIPPQLVNDIIEAYDFLEKFLGDNEYMVGNSMTIADFSLISTVSSVKGLIPLSEENHPQLIKWVKRMETLPNYCENNGEGAQALIIFAKQVMAELKHSNKMQKPILYGILASPPVRTTLLTAHAIGLDFQYLEVDLLKKEHLSEEFLKKNPQHSVPLLEDENEKYIWDSHAISTYLITKYAKDDSLYPKDPYKRALIDQRLHFDSGVLFPRLLQVARKIYVEHTDIIPQVYIDQVYEAYDFVEKFLETNTYIVGETLTVADFCFISSITSMEFNCPASPEKYPKINTWKKNLEKLPYYYEANGKGNEMRNMWFKKILQDIKSKA